MTNQKERRATGSQHAAIGFAIARGVLGGMEDKLSFDKAQSILLDPDKTLENIASRITWEILGLPTDPWIEEKKRIEIFYKKFFNRKVDWTKITLPAKQDGMNRLELVLSGITEDAVFAAYSKKFGAGAVWKYYDSITGAIVSQQERPVGDYAFCHVGGDEPDMLGKSYDGGIAAAVKFMTPKEGLIAAFRYRTETSKMYDVKGLTRFSALDSGGHAMYMRRLSGGQFDVCDDNRVLRHPDNGLRQVRF